MANRKDQRNNFIIDLSKDKTQTSNLHLEFYNKNFHYIANSIAKKNEKLYARLS